MGKDKKKTQGLFANIRHDLPASIVVFFVAVPLCLGIALASGAPLFSGIIAGIVGGIVVGMLSGSALGVSGPAAGLAVIVLNSIDSLGAFQAFLVAVVLAGVIQIAMGLLRAGTVSYYFPSSVVKGMLAAIGIIIIMTQIPHAIGYSAEVTTADMSPVAATNQSTFASMIRILDSITPGAVLVCTISLAILLIWDSGAIRKTGVLKFIQGPIIAVVAGIVYQITTSRFFPELAVHGNQLVNVPVAGDLTQFAGQFTFPDFSYLWRSEIWSVAITIAVVASLETLLSVEATDKLDPQRRFTNTNRELVAQGTGNMLSGLIGGLPITQVILRSSANIQSGARSKASAILHGGLLLLCVALIPFVLNLVPLAVLAAILFVIGFKLAKPSNFKAMYRMGWSQFLPFIVTIIGVVATDLLKGVGMGMGVAVILLLRESFKNSHFLHLETGNGNRQVKMTLAEEVSFLNKGTIAQELDNIPAGTHLTIDISNTVSIDNDVREIIDDFMVVAKSKGIQVDVITETARQHGNGVARKTRVPEKVSI